MLPGERRAEGAQIDRRALGQCRSGPETHHEQERYDLDSHRTPHWPIRSLVRWWDSARRSRKRMQRTDSNSTDRALRRGGSQLAARFESIRLGAEQAEKIECDAHADTCDQLYQATRKRTRSGRDGPVRCSACVFRTK